MQAALHLIFPPHCVSCGDPVAGDFNLCGPCWREAHFISGLVCDLCGTPLPGDDPDEQAICDDCIKIARPWSRGRAALLYRDGGRRMVLTLKHADRTELVRPAAAWMARAVQPIVTPGMTLVPIPLHRWRLLGRRYNQSALLAGAMARKLGLMHCPDLLLRDRATPKQDGMGVDARFANMAGALRVNPRKADRVAGQSFLLVDDVMTSGATFAAAAEVLRAAGAADIRVISLARVAKEV